MNYYCRNRGSRQLQGSDTLAHFNRERIPERVIPAHGVGACGEFELTHDISHLTDAKFPNDIGTKSKALIQVSKVGPGRGSADTLRDVRGWALKLFTEERNQDFVFNDIERTRYRLCLTRDTLRRTSLIAQCQEGIHVLMMVFSDRGMPKSVRHVNGYSGHTYKLTKKDGSFNYVKIQFKSNQGNDTLMDADATRLIGQDPDNHLADLWNLIKCGNFPFWTAYLQVMSPEQAETYRWNIFDMTKIWPHADFPLLPFGKLTLNKNPGCYFTDIELAAFSPSKMVTDIAPAADPIYGPYQRDGLMNATDNYGSDPNYVRSSLKPTVFKGNVGASSYVTDNHQQWVAGAVNSYTSEITDDDFA
ncbi:catalase A [Neonectria magnoliae]|uniref:Catalase A n=1 Tax=Neonectria magnoliae TaxID=2732573 RepID=A0ABR1I4W9_9HYPO